MTTDTLTPPVAAPEVVDLKPDDLSDLIGLAEGFFSEGKLPGKFDAETFLRNWSVLLGTGHAFIVALKQGDEMLGALGFCIMPDLNCQMLNSQELFWFVLPQHRHGRTAFRLIDAYEKKARELGAASVTMAHLEHLNQNLGAFYERRGYTKSEVLYRKTL